jgi:hypothetical protein
MIIGNEDLPFCGGNCTGIIDGPIGPKIFPAASPFKTYIQPNTGHGLNLHFNATGAYSVINSFLKENGL